MPGPSTSARTIPLLNAQQKARFEAVIASAEPRLLRRAQIILLAHQKLPIAQIAEQVGVSRSGVRYWLRRFRKEGMSILGDPSSPAGTPRQQVPRASSGVTVEALCARYSIDMAHARHVAVQALRLFDDAASIHALPPESRHLLNIAALLHNIAYELDPVNHHLAGRDILLRQSISGLSPTECRILACTTAFHRKSVDPNSEPAFGKLSDTDQQITLGLAAVLRVADGLDYSVTQTTGITETECDEDRLDLLVDGEFAAFNAARADRMADLWRTHFGAELHVRPAPGGLIVHGDLNWASLAATMTLPEAGRSLVGHYVRNIETYAEHVRDGGEDCLAPLEREVDRLHGVLRLFGLYFDATALSALKKDARWLQRAAGDLLEALAQLDTLQSAAKNIGKRRRKQVLRQFKVQADEAHKGLGKTLNGKRYRTFVTDLLSFSQKGGVGYFPGEHNKQRFVDHAALFVWQEMLRLRTEAGPDAEPATQYRRVRRFHHTLQYIADLAGPELREVLVLLQPLETQLRDLAVGQALLKALAKGPGPAPVAKKAGKKQKSERGGADALMKAVEAEMEQLREQIAAGWAEVDSAEFRRKLALAVATL